MSNSFPSLAHTPRAFPLPTISEDTLHYVLHLPPSYDPTSTALLLTQYVESLLIQPWLWNKDSWELKVSVNGDKLEGTMRVGDAVDDEWLVVWLLLKISEKWQDVVIGVRDTDGEFLLIEAANELPSWVSPENAENRLWLQGGHLHLIPLSIRSTPSSSKPRQIPDDEDMEKQFDPESYISEEDAIKAVRTGRYRVDEKMEQAVWDRISCYPDALNTHQHRTKAYLPVPIAKALKKNLELIQKAVEGFYVRDPSQLRAAARMTHFAPSTSILTPITMTRAAYAQLQGQAFHPPRIFGPEWHVPDDPNNEGEKRWRDLGIKIATGFEIMYKEGGNKHRSGPNNQIEDGSLVSDEGYKVFLYNLREAGWFGDELEGSEKWKVREKEAKKGYQSIKSSDTASQRPSFAYLVDSAISSASDLVPGTLKVDSSYEEDSESWLEVSPDELDGMMMRASGRTAKPGENTDGKAELGEEHGQALQDLAKKVEDFVGGQGDLTGARFEDELSDEDMDDSDDDDSEEERKTLEAQKENRLKNLIAPLPDDQWGKKTQTRQEGSSASKNDSMSSKDKVKKEVKFDHKDIFSSSSSSAIRPPRFAKQEYDGVVSESSDEDEAEDELPPAGTIGRKIAQMKWSEGDRRAPRSATIEEITEEDEEMERQSQLKLDGDIDLDEEMQRRVWGDPDEGEGDDDDDDADDGMEVDVDMAEEQEEFLKFAKEALGINDDLWKGIIGDREARGAFVPQNGSGSGSTSKFKPSDLPQPSNKSINKSKVNNGKKVQFDTGSEDSPQLTTQQGNSSLSSFDEVMKAMDEELSKNKPQLSTNKEKLKSKSKSKSKSSSQASLNKSQNPKPSSSNPLPPLPTEEDLENMEEDDLLAMDRELKAALKTAGISDDEDEDDEEMREDLGQLGEDDKREYEMMKHFLESYRSQSGSSGVVGNLFGRLGNDNKQ
ncbi:hypothetical protein I203_106209 [Kwoniella mangroviensis CBS 8507]|uniref:uncharacterized protein n=1 Tax=Kwoniella mangroviensis CBS 8507 TaxID=1296122 RepID=UPI00080D4981|nr:uncharacterized protein I203_04683 [Kwoniella mangroviensis CBS 8507]OCF66352.1 hypothetical protein I203_04683 [Kwoniella mangroviensis CBS 8507]